MSDVARKSFVATVVAVAVVAGAFALWHLKVLVALLLLAVDDRVGDAPGHRVAATARRVPRALGVLIHYLGFAWSRSGCCSG